MAAAGSRHVEVPPRGESKSAPHHHQLFLLFTESAAPPKSATPGHCPPRPAPFSGPWVAALCDDIISTLVQEIEKLSAIALLPQRSIHWWFASSKTVVPNLFSVMEPFDDLAESRGPQGYLETPRYPCVGVSRYPCLGPFNKASKYYYLEVVFIRKGYYLLCAPKILNVPYNWTSEKETLLHSNQAV